MFTTGCFKQFLEATRAVAWVRLPQLLSKVDLDTMGEECHDPRISLKNEVPKFSRFSWLLPALTHGSVRFGHPPPQAVSCPLSCIPPALKSVLWLPSSVIPSLHTSTSLVIHHWALELGAPAHILYLPASNSVWEPAAQSDRLIIGVPGRACRAYLQAPTPSAPLYWHPSVYKKVPLISWHSTPKH